MILLAIDLFVRALEFDLLTPTQLRDIKKKFNNYFYFRCHLILFI